VSKPVEWDWESQLTDGEKELLSAYLSKQHALDRKFAELEEEMEKLSTARGLIVKAASDRARKTGVKRVPFKL
jgi:hypothetical protein